MTNETKSPAQAAPVVAAPELSDEQIIDICERECGWLAGAKDSELVKFARAVLAAAMPAASLAVPAELTRIGELLRTQDNRITEAPMFVVEQKKPVVSDADYNDCRVEWRESENGDYELASPQRAARLEALFQAGRDTEGWTRYEMTDVWEFVTACLTEQACIDYLARNGHNLRETRIYAYGSFRNNEYSAVRNWLMSLPAAPTQAEGQNHE